MLNNTALEQVLLWTIYTIYQSGFFSVDEFIVESYYIYEENCIKLTDFNWVFVFVN